MRILFITNLCAHYRITTFELLSTKINVSFLFFSDGKDRYWDRRHGQHLGNFRGRYMWGIRVLGTRITPSLLVRLIFSPADIVIKCIGGRFALPVTYIATRLRRNRFILWTNLWYHPDTMFHRLTRPLTRWIYHHSDAIVSAGDHVSRFLSEEGVPRERIFVSHQAVANEVFSRPVPQDEKRRLRDKHALGTRKMVLYVGRFDEIKGLTYLLDGFALLPAGISATLVLVGLGSHRSRVLEGIRVRNIEDRVVLLDYVPNEELTRYYSIASVLVLPSITLHGVKEVWGMVISEAMNQGCPVIATDAVGAVAGGLVEHMKNGIVVPEKDARAIADALAMLLTDKDVENRLRSGASQDIRHWTYERQVIGFERAIDFVRKQHPDPRPTESRLEPDRS